MYFKRHIDQVLLQWADNPNRKPLLLRGARQVGKSTAVRHLGESFDIFVEINFERNPEYNAVFEANFDVSRIVSQISALSAKSILAGKTLLFFDEIQSCPRAIQALRYFREELPQLHIVAAGSLLEFALLDIASFGVGRISSIFMKPMSFDEFLLAVGDDNLINVRNQASPENPLPEALHGRLIERFRSYMLVGGMPEVVLKWVETHDYLLCQSIQDEIIVGYEDDFPKYSKRINPTLLRNTLKSVAVQGANKFNYSAVPGGFRTEEVKRAIELLQLSGLIIAVTRTAADGVPLGASADVHFRKFMVLDSGLMLRLQGLSENDTKLISQMILTASPIDLVNKGNIAEIIVGLEMTKYASPMVKDELFYWARMSKNSQAEVDYITTTDLKPLPVEVKAGTQGGMKSLWVFMREKSLSKAVRCSLENFGFIQYSDSEIPGAQRYVKICPIYAISQLTNLWH